MAKKTLNESTIRRFQKLANVKPINEMYNMREEEGMDDAPVDDMADAPVADDMEMTGDEEQVIEIPENDFEALKAALPALQNIVAMAGGEEMGEMDAELPAPIEGEEEEEEEEGDEALMEALRGISYTPSKQEVVNEVAKRVARRLQQAKLHEAKLNKALGRK